MRSGTKFGSGHGAGRLFGRLVPVAAVVLAALAGGALAWLPNLQLFGGGEAAAGRTVEIAFEDGTFGIPESLVVRIKRRPLGRVLQIDLKLPWPGEATPASAAEAPASGAAGWLLVSFEPDDGRLAPAERFDKIYRHYFAGPLVAYASGLMQYDFAADSPHADIQLFVDRRADPPAILRCDVRPSSLGPALCERRLRVSDRIHLTYRFARPRLDRWMEADRLARDLLAQIHRRR